ncbi:hypothetical protein GQ457_04G016480 [Hibiscus cannabinus]
MFAASFDSKMGCLCSVFDVKKQGKTVWVVRARNWKLRGGENRFSVLLERVLIASVGKARRQGGSNITFVQGGTETFREGFETFSMKVSKPCPKVSIPLMKILILPERVVYRSWTFGFDSDISRVTISGRFCDWTGSRGLHMLVSEPGYAIIGTSNEKTLPPLPPVGGEANEGDR